MRFATFAITSAARNGSRRGQEEEIPGLSGDVRFEESKPWAKGRMWISREQEKLMRVCGRNPPAE
jgi:hypothetical protein